LPEITRVGADHLDLTEDLLAQGDLRVADGKHRHGPALQQGDGDARNQAERAQPGTP